MPNDTIRNLTDVERDQLEDAMRDSRHDAIRGIRLDGVSVESAQDFANNQTSLGVSLTRAYLQSLGTGEEAGPTTTTREQVINWLSNIGTSVEFDSEQSLVWRSMAPALIERFRREEGAITLERLEAIATNTIRDELQKIDRNTNFNISLSELNEYRTGHGLPELRVNPVRFGGPDL